MQRASEVGPIAIMQLPQNPQQVVPNPGPQQQQQVQQVSVNQQINRTSSQNVEGSGGQSSVYQQIQQVQSGQAQIQQNVQAGQPQHLQPGPQQQSQIQQVQPGQQ